MASTAPWMSSTTAGSNPTTQASCPGGIQAISPGPTSASVPSSILMCITPDRWKVKCVALQLFALGFMCLDHLQPGSKERLTIFAPWTFSVAALPWSKVVSSSGFPNFFTLSRAIPTFGATLQYEPSPRRVQLSRYPDPRAPQIDCNPARRISLGHPRHLQRPGWKRFRAAPAAKHGLGRRAGTAKSGLLSLACFTPSPPGICRGFPFQSSTIVSHGSAEDLFQGALIDSVAIAEIDPSPHIASEAGVEELVRIRKACAMKEGQLYFILDRGGHADDSIVRPARMALPFQFLDYLGVSIMNDFSNIGEHLAAPAPEGRDLLVDDLGWASRHR